MTIILTVQNSSGTSLRRDVSLPSFERHIVDECTKFCTKQTRQENYANGSSSHRFVHLYLAEINNQSLSCCSKQKQDKPHAKKLSSTFALFNRYFSLFFFFQVLECSMFRVLLSPR